MVYALAFVAATLNAIASILQRLGVETAPPQSGFNAHLISYMLRRSVWIVGFFVMLLGFAAQATALHVGTLTAVQPILVTELALIVVTLGLWYGMTLRARDLAGVAAAVGGVVIFLIAAHPRAGSHSPSNARWLLVGLCLLGTAACLYVIGTRGPAWWHSLAWGASASLGFSLTAALTKTVTNLLTSGWGALFSSWPLYALAAIGLSSFLLMQQAFHQGPFAASQSTLILVNPFVSIGLGVALFSDRVHGGAIAVIFQVVGLLVMIAGGVLLSTSPLIVGVHNEDAESSWLQGRGRLAKWQAHRAAAQGSAS